MITNVLRVTECNLVCSLEQEKQYLLGLDSKWIAGAPAMSLVITVLIMYSQSW